MKIFVLGFVCVAGAALVGCQTSQERVSPATLQSDAVREHNFFRNMANWRTGNYRNGKLIALANPANTEIVISITEQRGVVYVNHLVAMDFPVSTGKASHPTPTGQFKILAKEKEYTSNLYGKVFLEDGRLLTDDADIRTTQMPLGAKFVGGNMPYWMRLTPSGVGLHVGIVPGARAASHGCIRLTEKTAEDIFAIAPVGMSVKIIASAPSFSQ